MKILLDENIDVRFKGYFPPHHQVFTVKEKNWNGIKNGELIQLLRVNTFDCWIVVDKNIPYQQNVATLPCLVIVLDVYRNTLKGLLPLMPSILKVLAEKQTDKVVIV
jgi:hypothetical protein